MSRRSGTSLVEMLVALAAGVLVCGTAAALLRADARLALARGQRWGRLETARIAATALRAEIAPALPDADVAAWSRDSFALRLFRGLAVTCAPPEEDGVLVRWSGARKPDPSRDSLVSALGPDGPALGLVAVAPASAACPGSGELLRLQLVAASPLPTGTPLLLFQPGLYALSGAALRVRHGREGRQPLTGDWLDTRRSRFQLRQASTAAGAGLEVTLEFTGTGSARRLRLAFPNAPVVDSVP